MTDRATVTADVDHLQTELRDLNARAEVLRHALYLKTRQLETLMGRQPPVDRYKTEED